MMHMLKGLATAAALVSLATPALAETVNPAAKLSVSRSNAVRAATSTKKTSAIAPVAIVVIALVVAGGLVLALDGDDDSDSN